jgi:hypothetical protein
MPNFDGPETWPSVQLVVHLWTRKLIDARNAGFISVSNADDEFNLVTHNFSV